MAYTKKTTTKDTEKVSKVVNEDIEIKEEVKPENKERVFADTDVIPCRSIISGQLFIEGVRSKILYTWADYDDVQDVEYRDLIYMVRTRGDRNIYTPRIIIEDDDFVKQNRSLSELYDSLYSTSDLREVIKLPVRQMVAEINKLPVGVRNSIKGIASTMIDAHELDSVTKIKALDEIFGTNMLLTLVQE